MAKRDPNSHEVLGSLDARVSNIETILEKELAELTAKQESERIAASAVAGDVNAKIAELTAQLASLSKTVNG